MNFPLICYKNVGRTFVRFVTIHAFDGQTDKQMLIGRPRLYIIAADPLLSCFFSKVALSKKTVESLLTRRYCSFCCHLKLVRNHLSKFESIVSKARSHFNGLVLVSISNVGFQLFSRMVLSEVKVKSEVEVKR